MTFEEILDQAIAMLQRRGRMTYRTLQRQFALDEDALNDLKDELLYAHPEVRDDAGRGLIWAGDAGIVSSASSAPEAHPGQAPLAYTPPHLAEKILTTRSALEGERKQVTVCFCDLVNSTALAARLGPEAMHTLLNQFFTLALDEVHRYEGTINQFLGDGFMALFGAPIAHEDHARRAVLAAVGIRRRLREDTLLCGSQSGVALEVRMGLHTGVVIVGAIGDNLRMDYTAVGDTTNVAARLQQAATPGQIVLSEATHRLVAGYCSTQPLGALFVKGKDTPLRAWEVEAVQASRTRLEVATERGLTPFVGRARELQLLVDGFVQAQDGHGQVVFLVGEAGLGKSRLLWEFRQRLGTAATWLEGHALAFGRASAFHPLIDLLKRNFRIEDGEPEGAIIAKIEQGVVRLDEALRPLLPYLRYLLAVDPGDPAVRTMDPQLRRAEIFDALRRLLLRAAEVRPQVVVFEDLHWMDQATEAFLTLTMDSLPASRVLCLCTYRPGYLHPFGERTYYTRIALSTLSTTDTIQMAQAMLTTAQLPEALQTLIVQKAEGNPFFVEEVVKSLQDVGALRRQGESYVLTTPLEDLVVPDTIQDVLMARIDRLPDAPKQTLQRAAVIGRAFTRRLLERLADIREHTEAHVQELKALELIYEWRLSPELAYMFKHALTQDVAYNSLLMQRRQELHRRIGQAMEELYADRLGEQYEVLAYHFAKGAAWAKALTYFCLAAEKATQAFATREAVALYDQALEAAGQLGQAVDVQRVMHIHQAQAELYVVLSDFARSRAAAECHFTLAQALGDPVQVGTALVGIGWAALWAQEFDQALDYVQQAIAVAQPLEAGAVLAKSYVTAGLVHEVTGVLDQSHEEITHALTLSRAIGDVACQVFALLAMGEQHNWQGQYAAASRVLAEGITLARTHHLAGALLPLLFTQGITLTGQGRYEPALGHLTEGVTLSEKVGDMVWGNRMLNSLGWLYSECGDLVRAQEFNALGAERSRQQGDPQTIANAELNLGDVALAQGDLRQAQEWLDRVVRLVQDPATSAWMRWRYSMHLFASLADLWLARGDPDQAQAYVEQCLELATRTRSHKYVIKAWRLTGDIALRRRQQAEAVHWFQQALALAQTIENPTQLWQTHLAVGRLCAESRRPEQAQQAYQAARDVIERVKATLHNTELRASLEQASFIRQVYDLSASS
jgi:class 3 adenylate cyclase/tetratricopeptide (TPR) repeat protein